MKKIIIGLSLVLVNYSFADTIRVPQDYPLVQQAIDSSANGDTVLVNPGIYIENLQIDHNITLASDFLTTSDTSYISQTVIDGGGNGPVVSAFHDDSLFYLIGFTITNGSSNPSQGAALTLYDPSEISYVNILNNSGPVIVYCSDSNNTFENVQIHNNKYPGGAVIRTFNSTNLVLRQVEIRDNEHSAIIMDYANSLHLENVNIINNKGYGIKISFDNVAIGFFAENTKIKNNDLDGINISGTFSDMQIINSEIAYNHGYGINSIRMASPDFEGVSIHNNILGGIFVSLRNIDQLNFSQENLCSIYQNSGNKGRDLLVRQYYNFADTSDLMLGTVFLDTFTVAVPSEDQALLVRNYKNTDIININSQTNLVSPVNSDLYVSPFGNDSNSGLDKFSSLKTINHALQIIQADSINPRNIYLAAGEYSPESNGERFPVVPVDFVSIIGESANNTIINANQEGQTLHIQRNYFAIMLEDTIYYEGRNVITLYKIVGRDQKNKLKNLKFTGASNLNTGLFYYGEYANTKIENCIFADNELSNTYGVLYVKNALPHIINCTFANNVSQFINFDGFPARDSVYLVNTIYQKFYNSNENTSVIKSISLNDFDTVFVNQSAGNYNLSDDSPAIDAGTAYYATNDGEVIIDLSESEYIGSAPDIGALEYGMVNSIENRNIRNFPRKYYLAQNYPNPFNPKTSINFGIPESSNVKITIYDSMGRLIKVLLNKQLQAGNHKITWNSTNLNNSYVSTGVYYYKIETDAFSQSKKMVLIR